MFVLVTVVVAAMVMDGVVVMVCCRIMHGFFPFKARPDEVRNGYAAYGLEIDAHTPTLETVTCTDLKVHVNRLGGDWEGEVRGVGDGLGRVWVERVGDGRGESGEQKLLVHWTV